MATFVPYYCLNHDLANKVHDLENDSFYGVLSNTAPNLTDAALTDITQIANGGGYTTNGKNIPKTYDNTTGTVTVTGSADVVWTGTAGGMAAARYLSIYNFTSAGTELLGYLDYGSSVVVAESETLTFAVNTVDFIDMPYNNV